MTPETYITNDVLEAGTTASNAVTIIEQDLVVVFNLVNLVKAELMGKHPGLLNIFNYLIGLK